MKKSRIILFVCMLFFSAIFAIPKAEAQSKFKDVGENHWAYDEINYLTGQKIIYGYPDGNFGPENYITRTQAVQMMLRQKGITDFFDVPDPGFADLKEGDYGYNEVAKAVELGIIHGSTNEKGEKVFNPNGKLTRAQMAKILSLAYDLTGNSGTEFSDVPITHWAYSYIQGLAKNQVTFGIGNGKYGANDDITRAQFAVMMARTLDESFRVVPTPPVEPTPVPTEPKPTGQTYPDGWTAPVLQSAWSPDYETNRQTLLNELGFESGRLYKIDGGNKAIIVNNYWETETEVDIIFLMWDGDANGYLKEAYRVPIVAKELFKLYFGKDATTIWNYFDNNDIPEHFTANGRNVDARFSEANGSLTLSVGRK